MRTHYLLGMLVGFLAGIIVVAIVSTILRKKGKFKAAKYDERQKAIQGVAYKYGFFALLITSMFACILNDFLEDYIWADFVMFEMSAIMISLLVFVGYAIFKDAYLGIIQRAKSFIILFGIIGICNIAIFVTNYLNGLDFSSLYSNLFCGITILIVAIMLGIKQIMDKKANNEDI